MNRPTYAILSVIGLSGLLLPDASEGQLQSMMSPLFAPVEISSTLSGLPESERRTLAKILEAARVMDGLFLEQVWAGNPSLLLELKADRSARGRARLNFFLVNKGPWSRLEDNEPFIPGVPTKPEGASYYPANATRDEVAAWFDSLGEAERSEATSFFTTIRRDPSGAFRAVPYSVEYQGPLAIAAALLREAAALTTQPTLARYLELRAEAFLSNDYYASDVAWMELDASIEPTIGPYEVYEDEWFNYKAAFEAFVTIRDDASTEQLSRFGAELQDLEDHLPIDPAYRNPKLGTLAPIRVVNVVFTAGDANSGVQTAAFNLPNDERVVREKGSKRVMLKNVQEAKFSEVLKPISTIALARPAHRAISFEAFFTHILMHELMHGLGPHSIQVNGRPTTVREELKETYSTIEEAKADISGLWGLHYLIDKGVVDRALEQTIYPTFLASTFRSIRFGINEAHGRGVAIQLNTFLDAGAVTVNDDGTFSVEPVGIRKAVAGLAQRLMMIQARGDYEEAKAVIETLGVVRPEVQRVLDRLQRIPVDIHPRYTTAESLAARD